MAEHSPIPSPERAADGSPRPAHRGLRLASYFVGVMLMVAAIWVVVHQADELSRVWASARGAPAWLIAAVLLLPLANWALTSTIFYTLTRPLASVGRWEMGAIIGSAWLLNMLPFKPGFVGRLAYHKAISGIPVSKSILVTITAMLTGGVGIVLALGAQLALDPSLRAAAPPAPLAWIALLIVVAALAPATILLLRRRSAGEPLLTGGRAIALVILLRVADTHLWSLRYFLAFRLIAHDQPYGLSVVVAGVSQIAGQMPIQLGLREWAVGLSSGALGGGSMRGASAAAAPGLTVDLICRGAEIVCALPVGIVSYVWIHRHMTKARA